MVMCKNSFDRHSYFIVPNKKLIIRDCECIMFRSLWSCYDKPELNVGSEVKYSVHFPGLKIFVNETHHVHAFHREKKYLKTWMYTKQSTQNVFKEMFFLLFHTLLKRLKRMFVRGFHCMTL